MHMVPDDRRGEVVCFCCREIRRTVAVLRSGRLLVGYVCDRCVAADDTELRQRLNAAIADCQLNLSLLLQAREELPRPTADVVH